MEKLVFLAAKKEPPEMFSYIIESILDSFVEALVSPLDCLFCRFLWAAGSVPAPIRSLLEPFGVHFKVFLLMFFKPLEFV